MQQIAVAILQKEGKVLIGQRPEGNDLAGYWEFPGGKCEEGETPEQCVVRECQEELHVTVGYLALLDTLEYTYPQKTVRLHFFTGQILQGEAQRVVHRQLLWVDIQKLGQYAFCPANAPVIQRLMQAPGR